MKLRKLQRRNESQVWFDDVYVYEDTTGQVIFCYNLAWGRIGSFYVGKIRETGATLEDIDTLITPNENLRWLPIEIIDDDQAEAYLDELDQTCSIPYPRLVTKTIST